VNGTFARWSRNAALAAIAAYHRFKLGKAGRFEKRGRLRGGVEAQATGDAGGGALSPRVRQSAHTSQERFAFVRARRSQRYAGETVLFFMKRPDSDRHNGNRAGSGGGIAGAAGAR